MYSNHLNFLLIYPLCQYTVSYLGYYKPRPPPTLSLSLTAGGVDYIAKSDSISLSESVFFTEHLVEVMEDGAFEGEVNEWFGVQLCLVSGDYDGRVTIETSTITIQIEDHDPRRGVHVHAFIHD